MSLFGTNSAFANPATATTDATFTGGLLPVARTGFVINVLAVTLSGTTATSGLTFNSKPAGAGTAISPLLSLGINGLINLSLESPQGYFTTNSGEGLTMTTTGTTPIGVLVTFQYVPG